MGSAMSYIQNHIIQQRGIRAILSAAALIVASLGPNPVRSQTAAVPTFDQQCLSAAEGRGLRVVCADLVALDQMLVYNRFGSFNPFGMIFALRRDVVPMSMDAGPADTDCNTDTGAHPPSTQALVEGAVRLRDCRRPRPVVLRANVGDLLYLRVTNLLAPAAGITDPAPRDFTRDFCRTGGTDDPSRALVAPEISRGDSTMVDHGEALCPNDAASGGGTAASAHAPDWPRTRSVNLVIQGLMPIAQPNETRPHAACFGLDAVAPGDDFTCLYEVVQEGTHFLSSRAAPAGGNGDGGSITHGLFGAVLAERPGTRWYRSQISQKAMDAVWTPQTSGVRHARQDGLNYEKGIDGIPVLNMARSIDGPDFRTAMAVEIVHSDLNAVIWCDSEADAAKGTDPLGCAAEDRAADRTEEPRYDAFREFSVFFHDELKTFYTRNFQELAQFGQLAGVRDGFAINYGASGMGTLLLANRKGIGPSASCMECLYEEFFLTSWANGDPALLEWYPDDPSNVHHSYLNDPVVFRNFHAGPKETHVFHLHAHQWFAGNDPGRGSYLDSQTVAPGQGFTYNIYHGGRKDGQGGAYVAGSGNRNRTVGDSIFHCHLYPHFAQGMWALWRVHDVLEDGTRKLPDGQAEPGLSTEIRATDQLDHKRTGSVDPVTGAWIGDDPATPTEQEGAGTPIPALVPLPGNPLPPLPSYAEPAAATPGAQDDGPSDQAALTTFPRRAASSLPRRGPSRVAASDRLPNWNGPERIIRAQATAMPAPTPAATPPDDVTDPAETPAANAMPGYPFYIAGEAGHRPPQAPLDIARKIDDAGNLTDEYLSGGLGRHVVIKAERKLDFISKATQTDDDDLAAALNQGNNRQRLEALRSQMVAKALALGDMTAHLEKAEIRPLDPEGSPLERAAQIFHHDGAGLTILRADGQPSTASNGGYETMTAPLPDTPAAITTGWFNVNGAPPAPGAPFADPCGGAVGRDGPATSNDPFVEAAQYVIDPNLRGFRRYEVSAVQLDLVVNQAGWHDPQARIDVLTNTSPGYKDSSPASRDRISPTTRDDSEPFFFRALSGECIEFRHTNELPKDLELDDFQVRTPTDTIGQHIHLVKFDVTSSDGSGNGWNYEDGTFAADELLARRCASRESAKPLTDIPKWGFTAATDALCKAHANKDDPLSRIWRLPMGTALDGTTYTADIAGQAPIKTRDLFQTTTQRWFADPILTQESGGKELDRTMRTVFSHDHFGPSSIQQHGFYTALLIEPNEARVCDPGMLGACTAAQTGVTPHQVANADAGWVGSHKVILGKSANDPFHPDYREFALAVADFALLYDPRDRETMAAVNPGLDRSGMARLNCEAQLAASGQADRIGSECGEAHPAEPSIAAALWGAQAPPWWSPGAPAWWAAGQPGDLAEHRTWVHGNLMTAVDAAKLRDHLVWYRSRAASPDGLPITGAPLAKPVAPPERPESISVDHHDPYLVNYRNAPIPLRLGTKDASGASSKNCLPYRMTAAGTQASSDSEVVQALMKGEMPECSYRYQLAGLAGDAAYALSSWAPENGSFPAREPETRRFEAYQDELLMFRLIQGAQEVQHSFNVVGFAAPRNVDQHFAQGMRSLATSHDPARKACFDAMRDSNPQLYRDWLNFTPAARTALNLPTLDPAIPAQKATLDLVAAYDALGAALARCDNIEGYTFAQEVGISEHFEMRGRLRSDLNTMDTAFKIAQVPGPAKPVGPAEASDYLYNFGTIDSLWNGAWGLLRVYTDQTDRSALLAKWRAAQPGGGAATTPLTPIAQIRQAIDFSNSPTAFGAAFRLNIAPLLAQAPGCPLPTNAQAGYNTAALVVALRVHDAFPGGTDYGGHRVDPDGLMLALLNPETLPDQTARDISNDDDWTGAKRPTRATLFSAVRDAYARPEPFVLRVNAGDCVTLRYVNTLTERTEGGGLPDALGDALLPAITPLNSDPQIAVSRITDGSGTHVEGKLTATTVPVTGLRPSARLALSVGLPGGDLIRTLPLGYGINTPAMDPATADRAEVSQELRFFAGRMRIAADNAGSGAVAAGTIATATVDAMQDRLREWTGDPAATYQAVATFGRGDFQILDHRFSIPGTTLSGEQKALMQAMAAVQLHEHVHWIPYAFGPVPVRVTGDVISQPPHGLFGVIDVLPRTWDIPQAVAPAMTPPPLRLAALETLADLGFPLSPTARAAQWRSGAVPREFGAPVTYEAAALAPEDPPAGQPQSQPGTSIREFVIFYQDGLTHHDWQSNIQWSLAAEDGLTGPDTSVALPRIAPDCPVCDDSYDRGDQGVSYRSRPFASLLRYADIAGNGRVEASDDLNALRFPDRFLDGQKSRVNGANGADHSDPRMQPLTLRACPGDQVVIRAVNPGGRARQRAFALNGMGYDDLFPGFGFPNAALLAPGKTASAWLHPPQTLAKDGSREPATGKVLWHDGPTFMMAGGAWGHVSFEYGADCPAPVTGK